MKHVKHCEPLAKHHETIAIQCEISALDAVIPALGTAISTPVTQFLAIAELVELCRCVTELLILEIWVFFTDFGRCKLNGFSHAQNLLINKSGPLEMFVDQQIWSRYILAAN